MTAFQRKQNNELSKVIMSSLVVKGKSYLREMQ